MSAPTTGVRTTTVTVRYFAGAKAAAGTRSETLELPAATSLEDLVAVLAAAHGDPLARVLAAASFLVDALAAHDRAAPLPADATVDVLPPFAGG